MSSQHSGWASLELRKLEDLMLLVVLALIPALPSLPSLRQGLPRFTTPFLRPEGLWSVTTHSGSCVTLCSADGPLEPYGGDAQAPGIQPAPPNILFQMG